MFDNSSSAGLLTAIDIEVESDPNVAAVERMFMVAPKRFKELASMIV